MQIVLPGALPDPGTARELIAHVQKTAPTLTRWMRQGHARVIACDTARAACTPYEQWLLRARGFAPRAGQNLSCGLGPLLHARDAAGTDAPAPGGADPVWLAELVHIAPSRDGAALLPARDLAITPDQSLALFDAAQRVLAESGFTARRTGIERWRILPQDTATLPASVSPSLVGITSVNDWWPQDAATRPWRRLVNELQMLWFDHPVNRARAAHGLRAVNSVWVFGGGAGDQFHETADSPPAQTHAQLAPSHATRDWGGWLAALADLEKNVFEPLARQNAAPALVLIGRDRLVELTPGALRKLMARLPGGRDAWRTWWSPPN